MTLAEMYYGVAGDLELQAANLTRTADFLKQYADQLSEQSVKEGWEAFEKRCPAGADGESRTDEQRYNEHIKVMEDLKRGEP